MASLETQGKMDVKPITKLISAEALVDMMIEKWKKSNAKSKKDIITEAHLKALDDLVSVNSLFSIAVFVGLSLAARGQKSLETREKCQAGVAYSKMLILYEVVAFACFLLSSLLAKVIKLHLTIKLDRYIKYMGTNFDLKDFMLILAASTSVAGVVSMTLSVVNLIQIRIGLLSCGSSAAKWAVCSLIAFVGLALIIYVVSIAIAIYMSMKSDKYSVGKSNEQTKTGAKTSVGETVSVYVQIQVGGAAEFP